MYRLFFIALVSVFVGFTSPSWAVTVEDSKGTFSIDYTPKRIIVLEFSFADALASVGVSPVGIADDKDPSRVLKEVRDVIGDWQSVGTRSQPSLEVIASLKPDLIIADISRHEAVYEDLQKIAPTLILPSRRETYKESLKAAAIIGKVVGKEAQIQARLKQHQNTMAGFAQQLPNEAKVQFVVARANELFLHTADSYAGGVIHSLGLSNLDVGGNAASQQVGLEQLISINPDYLIVGNYVSPSIIDKWQNEPLWNVLQASRNARVYHVDGNTWARCRGIMAAERMAKDLVTVFAK